MAPYWQIKCFRTRKTMNDFILKKHGKIQWHEVFVNNRYAIEYKDLIIIDIK